MKKILTLIAICLSLIACGDDVTNINGYTDEQVQAKIDSTLDAQDVVLMTDTVYQQTVDTIYNMVIDTVTNELVDTIYQRVVDTVTHELVDTIYQKVIDTVMTELVDTIYNHVVDTVYKELVDTIYQKVVDTVFTTLEHIGLDTELPRDTSITLYDTTDNQITARIYKGIVYKNVFYDTTKYKFNEHTNEPINITIFKGWYSTGLRIYSTDRCGLLDKPDWNDFGWEDSDYARYVSESKYNYSLRRLKGWRLFNAKDANILRDNLDKIISDDSEVYLNTITNSEYLSDFEANVATQNSPNQTSKGKLIKYMCAYDLK